MLPQDTTHFLQRLCYQQGGSRQDPAGNRTTRRPSDHRKETQTAVVWSCLPYSRSGQNHIARHSERRKKTRQTEEEVGRQHQGMDRPGVRQVPEGSGEQEKWTKLVAKSSVVPQRPSRLRDWWWWWRWRCWLKNSHASILSGQLTSLQRTFCVVGMLLLFPATPCKGAIAKRNQLTAKRWLRWQKQQQCSAFFLVWEEFGRMFDDSFAAHAFFFFFFKWRSARGH